LTSKVIFSIILINASCSAFDNTGQRLPSAIVQKKTDYTYVRVYKDGIWWIEVYEDGRLIDVYPDVDQSP